MSKIKIIFFLILGFVVYKGYEAFTEFKIGVSDRVALLEKSADIERQGEVIALMMYLGNPPRLNEHLLVKNETKSSNGSLRCYTCTIFTRCCNNERTILWQSREFRQIYKNKCSQGHVQWIAKISLRTYVTSV